MDARKLERCSTFALIRFDRGTLTLRPHGPAIGEREAVVISREANQAFATVGRALKRLVLDFHDVEMVSSMGLGLCIDLQKTAKRNGAGSYITGLSPTLLELFRMMKVDRLYEIARDDAELAKLIAA